MTVTVAIDLGYEFTVKAAIKDVFDLDHRAVDEVALVGAQHHQN